MAMENEVRYRLCRPEQIVARREACPVAYVPIGTLEWRGPHNPVGLDTLQAEGAGRALCGTRRRAAAGYSLKLFFEKKTKSAPRIISPR